MDIDALMTQPGMRTWTDEQRDNWTTDAVQVRQLAQIFRARMANTHIDGDSAGTAARRARKVGRRFEAAARLLEKAAAQIEGANAFYVREVIELPARRTSQQERKEMRRQKLGIAAGGAKAAIAGSLAPSTAALHHGAAPVGNPQVNTAQQPVYTNPQFNYTPQYAGQPLPSIGDVFDQEAM